MRAELFRAQGVDVLSEQGAVLRNICLSLYENEVLGVYDVYNGGKQALSELVERRRLPSAGTVFFSGLPYSGENAETLPRVRRVSGHETLNDSLSLWENLLLRSGQRGLKRVSPRSMRRCMVTLFREYGIPFSPEQALRSLPPIDHFMLELLKAHLERVDIAVVSDFNLDGDSEQTDRLRRLMRRLSSEGMSILITSHRFELLRRYADRIALLSNGTLLKIFPAKLSPADLLKRAFPGAAGEEDAARYHTVPFESVPVLCTVPELPVGETAGPELTLRRGELVELLDPSGSAAQHLKLRKENDICFLNAPLAGLIVEELSPADNLCLGMMERVSRHGVLRERPQELILQEFAEWYGSDIFLERKNCRNLTPTERIAIALYRLRLRHPKVLFCMDVRRELNPSSRKLMLRVVRELTKSGSAVCLVDANDGDYESGADRVFVADGSGILKPRESAGKRWDV